MLCYCRHHDLCYCEKHGSTPCFSPNCKLENVTNDPRFGFCCICSGLVKAPVVIDNTAQVPEFTEKDVKPTPDQVVSYLNDLSTSADYVQEKNRKFAEIYGVTPDTLSKMSPQQLAEMIRDEKHAAVSASLKALDSAKLGEAFLNVDIAPEVASELLEPRSLRWRSANPPTSNLPKDRAITNPDGTKTVFVADQPTPISPQSEDWEVPKWTFGGGKVYGFTNFPPADRCSPDIVITDGKRETPGTEIVSEVPKDQRPVPLFPVPPRHVQFKMLNKWMEYSKGDIVRVDAPRDFGIYPQPGPPVPTQPLLPPMAKVYVDSIRNNLASLALRIERETGDAFLPVAAREKFYNLLPFVHQCQKVLEQMTRTQIVKDEEKP